MCCDAGYLDECGVCGGDGSSCLTRVTVGASVRAERAADLKQPNSTFHAEFTSGFSRDVAIILGVKETLIRVNKMVIRDVRRHTSRRRSVLQAFSSMSTADVNFDVLPPAAPDEGGADAGSTTVSTGGVLQVADALSAAIASGAGGLTDVGTISPVGVCGNSQCEKGERCDGGGDDSCCLKDCPIVTMQCPIPGANRVGDGTRVCGDNGVCIASAGVCKCHAGYTGDDCGECDGGGGSAGAIYVRSTVQSCDAGGGGCVNRLSCVPLLLSAPPPPPTRPSPPPVSSPRTTWPPPYAPSSISPLSPPPSPQPSAFFESPGGQTPPPPVSPPPAKNLQPQQGVLMQEYQQKTPSASVGGNAVLYALVGVSVAVVLIGGYIVRARRRRASSDLNRAAESARASVSNETVQSVDSAYQVSPAASTLTRAGSILEFEVTETARALRLSEEDEAARKREFTRETIDALSRTCPR